MKCPLCGRAYNAKGKYLCCWECAKQQIVERQCARCPNKVNTMMKSADVLCTPCGTAQVVARQAREAAPMPHLTQRNGATILVDHKELVELFARFLEDRNKQ